MHLVRLLCGPLFGGSTESGWSLVWRFHCNPVSVLGLFTIQKVSMLHLIVFTVQRLFSENCPLNRNCPYCRVSFIGEVQCTLCLWRFQFGYYFNCCTLFLCRLLLHAQCCHGNLASSAECSSGSGSCLSTGAVRHG